MPNKFKDAFRCFHAAELMLFVLCFTPGCAYINPLIQDANVVSVAEENDLGTKLSKEVSTQMKIIESADAEKVRTIGAKLVSKLGAQGMSYHFNLVEDASPNAFTIPGGYIYVHSGLLKFTHDDSELAGVIAHEIGHAYERHPTKSITRAYGTQYLTELLFRNQKAQFKNLAFTLAQNSILTRYSRSDETEADEVGQYLLEKAGYSRDGLIRFLRKLQSLEPGHTPFAFLSSHPPTPERIAHLESLSRSSVSTPEGIPG